MHNVVIFEKLMAKSAYFLWKFTYLDELRPQLQKPFAPILQHYI